VIAVRDISQQDSQQALDAEVGNEFHAVIAAEPRAVEAAVDSLHSREPWTIDVRPVGEERSVVSISFAGFAPALEYQARRALKRIKRYAEELESAPRPRLRLA
jgi:hypothetical protein